jgi:hypothetical protein
LDLLDVGLTSLHRQAWVSSPAEKAPNFRLGLFGRSSGSTPSEESTHA